MLLIKMEIKMPRFRDIPQFTKWGHWAADYSWKYMFSTLDGWKEDSNLNLNPDFQRGHVWTKEQGIAFVEFKLMGGRSGGDILFNCPEWRSGRRSGEFVLVDGKQRLNAVSLFMENKLPAFGHLYKEYEDKISFFTANFRFHINELKTKREVLQWYLDLNTGGVVHTSEEIEKVKALLQKERKK